MKKKIISAAMVVAIGAATLTGCGGNVNAIDIFAEPIQGEITVSAFDARTFGGFLEEAARRFEEMHPGTRVNVEIAGTAPQIRRQEADGGNIVAIQGGDDSQAIDDYIRRMNTELMSGRGPDIIALDVLPFFRYADMGLLADLSDFMERDDAFNMGDFAENILRGTLYRGGQYMFPLDFSFNFFAYNSALAPDFQAVTGDNNMSQDTLNTLTFTQMFDALTATSLESGYRIFPMPSFSERGADVFSEMFAQEYERFIDVTNREVNLNDGAFSDLLETVQSFVDDGLINGTAAMRDAGNGQIDMRAFMRDNQEPTYARISGSFALASHFTRELGTQNMMVAMGGGMTGGTDDEIAGLIANDRGQVQFSTNMPFGINSNSQNQRTAWEFLKFLAGEEMQTTGLTRPDSIPVNNNARAQRAEMEITGELLNRRAEMAGGSTTSGTPGGAATVAGDSISGGAAAPTTPTNSGTTDGGYTSGSSADNGSTPGSGPAGDEMTSAQAVALENYLQKLDSFIAQLNTFVLRDDRMDRIIRGEARHFFDGSRSADEVANALQNRLNLYLNE